MNQLLKKHCLLVLAATSLVVGCGPADSSLVLMPVDDILPSDGRSGTTIKVMAWFRDEPVSDIQVTLTASAGVFTERNRREISVRLAGGEAIAEWKAPYDDNGKMFLGSVEFTASYTDPNRMKQEAKAIVEIVEPPPIDGSSFRFWCSASNVQRATSSSGPVHVPCTVEARDINGNNVPVDNIRFGFMTETGRMDFDRHGELEWVLTPGEIPEQVEPFGDAASGEPRWNDQAAGVIRNPRDGIATLVVHAHGRPSGNLDPLHGEPFVDVNDNGEWDPGEEYYDANQNGQYDGPTGSTEDRRIWRWAKIMVTGPISETAAENASGLSLWDTAGQSRQNIQITRGANASIGLLLIDENLNPVASHPGNTPDEVRLTYSPRDVVSQSNQSLTADTMGLTFEQQTGRILGGSGRSGYLQGSHTYFFRVFNNRDADDEDGPVRWSIDSVEVRRVPRPGGSSVTERLDGHELPMGYLQ